MERKTKIQAEEGRQDLTITREFDLPLHLLFRAYTDAEIVAQWMGTKVVKFGNKKHDSYRFETSDPSGTILFSGGGVIHELIPDRKIIRTFEMDNAGFDVQLEYLEFEALTDETSKLTIHSIYRTAALRDKQLKLPFSFGLNMAHDKLQDILNKLK